MKSQLNEPNCITEINARAVFIVKYSAGILKWMKDELQNMDRKTRKFLNIYQTFHTQGYVDRLYFKLSKGGKGWISVEDSVDMEIGSLRKYLWKSDEKVLKVVHAEETIGKGKKKYEIRKQRQDKYQGMALNQFFGEHSRRKGC